MGFGLGLGLVLGLGHLVLHDFDLRADSVA